MRLLVNYQAIAPHFIIAILPSNYIISLRLYMISREKMFESQTILNGSLRNKEVKLKFYFIYGVQEYWIVN